MEYADYDYYTYNYRGSLTQDLFFDNIVKASKIIDKSINIKLTEQILIELDTDELDDIKHTTCLLVDFLENTKSNKKGYVSQSIDGVSKILKSNDILKSEKKEILNNLPQKLTRYL